MNPGQMNFNKGGQNPPSFVIVQKFRQENNVT